MKVAPPFPSLSLLFFPQSESLFTGYYESISRGLPFLKSHTNVFAGRSQTFPNN